MDNSTNEAIAVHRKILQAERHVEELKQKEKYWLDKMPAEDRGEYFTATEQITREMEVTVKPFKRVLVI